MESKNRYNIYLEGFLGDIEKFAKEIFLKYQKNILIIYY